MLNIRDTVLHVWREGGHLRILNLVLHIFGHFVWVNYTRHGHLFFSLLFLSLSQRLLPLFQIEIRVVSTSIFLQNETTITSPSPSNIKRTVGTNLTIICIIKSLKCSLNAGRSSFRLNMPWTIILIWFSVKCEKALENRVATNSCMYKTLSIFGGPSGLLILLPSTNLNIYAKMVACIPKPIPEKEHYDAFFSQLVSWKDCTFGTNLPYATYL